MDITPAKDNQYCRNDGVLVTDKKLESWKPSNPKGYASWFEEIAELTPSYYRLNESRYMAKDGDIEELPEQTPLKGILRRTIQIMKRHRDIFFNDKPDSQKDCAPISIIITTLAAHSYKHQILTEHHDNDFDLMMSVVCSMPSFIERSSTTTGIKYQIKNPTTDGENFAEKWNEYPERAHWFYKWHSTIMVDLERLGLNIISKDGLDGIAKNLTTVLGNDTSIKALNTYSDIINNRRDSAIYTLPNSGIISTSTGISVKRNTFFGG